MRGGLSRELPLWYVKMSHTLVTHKGAVMFKTRTKLRVYALYKTIYKTINTNMAAPFYGANTVAPVSSTLQIYEHYNPFFPLMFNVERNLFYVKNVKVLINRN